MCLFKIHSNIVLPSMLSFPKDLLPVGLSVKIFKAVLFSSIQTTWLAHLKLLGLIILTILAEWNKLWSSSSWKILHFSFSPLLGPNICLRSCFLFSNALSPYSSFNTKEHVSHPYCPSGNIIVLYLNFQIIPEKSRRLKCLNWIITSISCFTYILFPREYNFDLSIYNLNI